MKIKTTRTFQAICGSFSLSQRERAGALASEASANSCVVHSWENRWNRASRSAIGFTLIELLVVIAIIAIIAALLLPAGAFIERKSLIQNATSERTVLEAAIDNYKSKLGYYPPSNGQGNPFSNQLYYELAGTTNYNTPNGVVFNTLDNLSTITTNIIVQFFGVSGFMNCDKGSGDDAIVAQNFLPALKPGQIGIHTNGDGTQTCVITTAVHSDSYYTPPLSGFTTLAHYPANPWRYVCPGTNNPNSYDLWVQVYVGGKTQLVCNWFKDPKVNYPLP